MIHIKKSFSFHFAGEEATTDQGTPTPKRATEKGKETKQNEKTKQGVTLGVLLFR